MSKLLIHETDPYGDGYYRYNGTVERYYHDDDFTGNIRAAVEALIDIGFIKEEDVLIVEGEDIYDLIEEVK